MYFSDSIGDTIRRVSGGQLDTIAGTITTGTPSFGSQDGVGLKTGFHTPEGLALDAAGNLYVADSVNHTIRKIELATQTVTTLAGLAGKPGAVDGVGNQARFNLPLDLLYDAGALYVADSGNGAIRRIDLATRTVTTWAGLLGQRGAAPGPLPARLNRPRGLVQLGPGQIAFIDEQAGFVLR